MSNESFVMILIAHLCILDDGKCKFYFTSSLRIQGKTGQVDIFQYPKKIEIFRYSKYSMSNFHKRSLDSLIIHDAGFVTLGGFLQQESY